MLEYPPKPGMSRKAFLYNSAKYRQRQIAHQRGLHENDFDRGCPICLPPEVRPAASRMPRIDLRAARTEGRA